VLEGRVDRRTGLRDTRRGMDHPEPNCEEARGGALTHVLQLEYRWPKPRPIYRRGTRYSRRRILLRDEDQPEAVGWNVTESVRSRLVIWDSRDRRLRRLDAKRCWALWVGASRSAGVVRARRASRWTTRRAPSRTAAVRHALASRPQTHPGSASTTENQYGSVKCPSLRSFRRPRPSWGWVPRCGGVRTLPAPHWTWAAATASPG